MSDTILYCVLCCRRNHLGCDRATLRILLKARRVEGVLIATITICEDKEKVEASSRIASEWLKQYLAASIVSNEEVSSLSLEVEEHLQGAIHEGVSEPAYKQALRLLSVQEVGEVLGMGRSWVYQQIRAGEMPSVQLGGTVKVRQKDLEEYVENHTRS